MVDSSSLAREGFPLIDIPSIFVPVLVRKAINEKIFVKRIKQKLAITIKLRGVVIIRDD